MAPEASQMTRALTVALALLSLPCPAQTETESNHRPPAENVENYTVVDGTKGYLLVLPGVWNARFHLQRLVAAAQEQLPGFEIEVRRWGVPLLGFYNLSAYEQNLGTATEIAKELASRRWHRPDEVLYLMGYSGGGGLAALVAAALPSDVTIDRLILVAPAIAPDFPLEQKVLPHVSEFIVSYSSERDIQAGLGTKVFGTIDRRKTRSAGSVGFQLEHPRVLNWRWGPDTPRGGHRGNHLSYLRRQWQQAMLLPALNPVLDARRLYEIWHHPKRTGAEAAAL